MHLPQFFVHQRDRSCLILKRMLQLFYQHEIARRKTDFWGQNAESLQHDKTNPSVPSSCFESVILWAQKPMVGVWLRLVILCAAELIPRQVCHANLKRLTSLNEFLQWLSFEWIPLQSFCIWCYRIAVVLTDRRKNQMRLIQAYFRFNSYIDDPWSKV